MDNDKKLESHDTLHEMDKHDAEQPGEVKPGKADEATEATAREDD